MVWIGLDGGASGARATRVVRSASGALVAEGPRAVARHAASAFAPVPLERQLAELRSGGPRIDDAERAEGERWVRTLCDVVARAAGPEPGTLGLGACVPGIATVGGRGVAVSRHGPRLPRLLDDLEEGLRERGFALEGGAQRLLADGEAAGWGEELAEQGRFRGVASALWVACGTGVAEAWKLAGRVAPQAEMRVRLPAPWALELRPGRVAEDLVSMRAVNAAYTARSGAERAGVLLEEAAAAGERRAREVLETMARDLADFLLARLRDVALAGEWPLERVVLGGHAGRFATTAALEGCFLEPLHVGLARGLAALPDEMLHAAYLDGDGLRAELVVASRLVDPAALGAAGLAVGLAREPTA